jgi:hypothetical protein
VHCLSRTPTTNKSQLGSNYSALTGKFEATRTLNRDHFIIPSDKSSSEIIEIKETGSIDEMRNCVPFLMDNTYHAIVRFEPMNFSYSQQTTASTLSCDSSLKNYENQSDSKFNSFARKLRKCTQKAFIFQTKANNDEKVGNGSNRMRQQIAVVIDKNVNSSSLKEVDEEFSIVETPHVAISEDFNVNDFYHDTS